MGASPSWRKTCRGCARSWSRRGSGKSCARPRCRRCRSGSRRPRSARRNGSAKRSSRRRGCARCRCCGIACSAWRRWQRPIGSTSTRKRASSAKRPRPSASGMPRSRAGWRRSSGTRARPAPSWKRSRRTCAGRATIWPPRSSSWRRSKARRRPPRRGSQPMPNRPAGPARTPAAGWRGLSRPSARCARSASGSRRRRHPCGR